MEDQGKRLLLAVAVAFALMMGWSLLFPPEKQEPEPPKSDDAARVEDEPATEPGATEPGATEPAEATPEAPAEPVAEVAPKGPEQIFELEYPLFTAKLSSYGASLVSWKLSGSHLEDRKTGEGQEMVPVDQIGHRPLAISFENSTYEIPAGAEWRGSKKSDTEVRFTWETPQIRVIKDFEFYPEHYAVELTVDIEVLSGPPAKQSLHVVTSARQDPDADTGGGMGQVGREWKAACYVDGELETASTKSLLKKDEKVWAGRVGWGGFLHSYFLEAVSPKVSENRRIDCVARAVEGDRGAMTLSLVYPTVELEARAPMKESMVAFIGPKYLDQLEALTATVGYGETMQEAVDLGYLAVIAGPLLWLLKWFYGFIGDWGLAIILLTVVVKGLTLPWTHKSMKSMQAMAKLRPQLEKLREKHKDDRQAQQAATMQLFKTHGVNPMAGCLPMLLQMPIWFALYRALTVAAELYQTEFLWLGDLTLADPYYIMPVLLTGMMFLQTTLTPSTATGAQQKMMTYGMPIMFGVFSLFFPAGLTLYIFTNTVLTALHHLYLHKQREAEAAASGGSVSKEVVDVVATERPSNEASSPAETRPAQQRSGGGKGRGKGKKKKR